MLDATAMRQRTLFKCQVTILGKILNQEQEGIIIVTLILGTIFGVQSMTHGKETSTQWHLHFTLAITFLPIIMTGVIVEDAELMLSMSIPI